MGGALRAACLAIALIILSLPPPLLTRHPRPDGAGGEIGGGMFHDVLTDLLGKCCAGRDEELSYDRLTSSTTEMHRNMRNFTFTMPVSLSIADMEHLRVVNIARFLPLLASPGVLVIGEHDVSHPMIEVIFQAWPLFLLILGMTLTAGVVIWFLDHNRNPQQFPKKFLTGWLEGVWWAFVSMTTVGYGDIAPRSVAARIFGVLWILIGICIISIFTSIVTAALTSESTSEFSMQGLRAGVLRHSDELMVALSHGANPVRIPGIRSIRPLIDDGTIDVAVLEHFVATAHLNQIKDNDLSTLGKLPQNRIFGILLWNVSAELYNCFSENVLLNEQEFTETIMEKLDSLQKEEDRSVQLTSEIFDTYGYIPIYVIVGIFVLCFIIFLIWEFAYRRPKAQKKKLKTRPKLEAFLFDESLQELQIRQNRERANLEEELKEFGLAWDQRLKLQALKHKCERDEYAKRNMPTLIHTLNTGGPTTTAHK